MTQETKEIDFIDIAKFLMSYKGMILKITLVSAIIGLVLALLTPKEFVSGSKLLPDYEENQNPSLGSLSGLAGLAGIDISSLSSSSSVLSPLLYPQISNSLPFLENTINDTIEFENLNMRLSSFDYLKNYKRASPLEFTAKITIGLPGAIKNLFVKETTLEPNDDQFARYSKEDWKIFEKFMDRVNVVIDEEIGIITISTQMPDKLAAAQLNRIVEKELKEKVIEFKTEKARQYLSYIEKTYLDVKNRYDSLTLLRAATLDKNRNLTTETANARIQQIEDEYQIGLSVYRELSTQYEEAKLKLKEETPVFTVLEPSRIPDDKTSPSTILNIIIFMFLGLFISLSIFLSKYFLKAFQSK